MLSWGLLGTWFGQVKVLASAYPNHSCDHQTQGGVGVREGRAIRRATLLTSCATLNSSLNFLSLHLLICKMGQ